MEVEIIKAKGAGEDTSTGRKIDRLRVAAYCRVSTDDEDQIKSYNSMVRYYTDLIKSNKQWVFAGVFADKAITGTKTAKKFDRLREAIKTSIIWSTSFCIVAGLVMAVFSTQIISQFTEGDTQMILAGQKSLFANGLTFILFGFYTVYSSLFLALGKGAAGFFLGACRQGICFIPVILLLPMVWGMNGILYAQPIADVISVVITVFMALHLHRELSMAEKQVMSNSEM